MISRRRAGQHMIGANMLALQQVLSSRMYLVSVYLRSGLKGGDGGAGGMKLLYANRKMAHRWGWGFLYYFLGRDNPYFNALRC
jgi:hypothetical protein